MLRNAISYCIKNTHIGIYIFSILYCCLLLIFPDSLQLGLLLTILFIIGSYILTRNLLTSLAITFLISSQFFSPAKIYQFEYASASEYISELKPNGIIESISLNISDIVSMFIVLLLLKNKFLYIFNRKALGAKRLLISALQTPPAVWIMLSWFIYFLLSLYGSLYLSFSPTFSLNLLMQYAKMAIAFISILYLFIGVRSKRALIYIILLSMLIFQSFLGISQFAESISNYGSAEKLVTADIEQNTTFSRITGVYGSANAHGYSIATLLLLSLPFIIKQKKWFLSAIGCLGALSIILSQSRTVWLGFVVLILLNIRQIYQYVRRVLPFIFQKIYYVIPILIVFMVIVYPRIEASNVFFTEEGGGHLRLEMFADGVQLIKESPWVGYGVGTEIRVLLNRLPNGYIHTFPGEIHNIFFQIAIESGIPAAIAFFIPFILLMGIWITRMRKKTPVNYFFISAACGIIMAITFYSLQPAYGRRDFITLGIILGVGIGAAMESSRKKL